jgi:hypothetical protein
MTRTDPAAGHASREFELTEGTRALIREIAAEASRTAVEESFRRLGLHDENAGDDVRELRDLLENWRAAKTNLLHRFLNWVFTAALAAAAAWAAIWHNGTR